MYGTLTAPSTARVSMLEQAAHREGLVLSAACVAHGRADCSPCIADAIARLSVLVGL